MIFLMNAAICHEISEYKKRRKDEYLFCLMNSILTKLGNITHFKDTVAIMRGIYRVTEGINPHGSASIQRRSSWMDEHQ